LLRAQVPWSNVGQVAHVGYRRHLESLRKKLTLRVALLRRLAGSGATTLRTATLGLVHSTAEYCAPVWWRSAYTRFIGPAINHALRIVSGCLLPTPADNLPILTGIQPAELRRNRATLSLAGLPWGLDNSSTQHSLVHRVQMHDASNRDTHLYPPHNNSLVYLTTTTYVRRTGRITNGMRIGRTVPQDSAFSSPTPANTPPERPPKKSLDAA